VAAGHEAETVDRVMKLVTRSEFKRKQSPPGLKVTDRAFGTGWRMPIAQKWLPTAHLTQAQATQAQTQASQTAALPIPAQAAVQT
jgi:NAD+ synthase (glutamine-hydrolysing)